MIPHRHPSSIIGHFVTLFGNKKTMKFAAIAPHLLALATAQTCTNNVNSDPCLPGGKYDPITDACTGYAGDCFGCYSGDTCDDLNSTSCVVTLAGGQPAVFAEYFEGEENGEPCR